MGEEMKLRFIGSELRKARNAAGMTQGEVASRAGIAANTLSQYEAGTAQPSIDVLCRLAEALGQPVARFFAGEARETRNAEGAWFAMWEARVPPGYAERFSAEAFVRVECSRGRTCADLMEAGWLAARSPLPLQFVRTPEDPLEQFAFWLGFLAWHDENPPEGGAQCHTVAAES